VRVEDDLPGARSARLVAWGTAFLTGAMGLADAAAAIAAGDEAVAHDGGETVGVDRLLARLRADGGTGLELLLPVPGDVRGLPGPGPFSTACLDTGEGVLTRGAGRRTGLVPTTQTVGPEGDALTVTTWTAYAVPVPELLAPPLLTVAEAEADLRAALTDATRELARLDTARWRPDVERPLARMRRDIRQGDGPAADLPPVWPARARTLLAQADALARVLALAEGDPGAAQTGGQVRDRGRALRGLATAVRRARVAAYDSPAADAVPTPSRLLDRRRV